MWAKYSQGGKVGYQYSEFIVEEESEISSLPKVEMGNTVYVVSTGEYWMIDSKGKWHVANGKKEPISCDCQEESTIWQELEN